MNSTPERSSTATNQVRSILTFLTGLSFFILVSFGVAPLVQWFVFDHANSLVGMVFRDPARPWVWIWPALLGCIACASMCLCGALTQAADPERGGV